jgi:hypothetical protein
LILYKQEISHRQSFPVTQKIFIQPFIGTASWQDFCNVFCKFFIGTQFENSVGIYKNNFFDRIQKNFLTFLLVGLSPGQGVG